MTYCTINIKLYLLLPKIQKEASALCFPTEYDHLCLPHKDHVPETSLSIKPIKRYPLYCSDLMKAGALTSQILSTVDVPRSSFVLTTNCLLIIFFLFRFQNKFLFEVASRSHLEIILPQTKSCSLFHKGSKITKIKLVLRKF